jgi:hypothetical protein
VVTTLAGSPGVTGSANGTGSAASFNIPTGVAVDSGGNIYVADSSNDTIRELAPSGLVTTIAGSAGAAGSADGLGPNARFDTPADIAVDTNDVVYVADNLNNTVRRIAQGNLIAPQIQTQPSNQSVANGQSAVFTLAVPAATSTNTPLPLSYQWQSQPNGGSGFSDLSNGAPYSISSPSANTTATASTLTVTAATAMNGTQFRCVVSNNAGSATSSAATLSVSAASIPPQIQTPPVGATLNSGSTVVLTVIASGSPTSYEWFLNNVPLGNSAAGAPSDIISGATGPQLVITDATAASDGSYTVVAINSGGSSSPSTAAVLQVAPSSNNPGAATSISARAFVGTGDNILIGGFYIVGSTSRTVLVQGLGPGLTALGVAGALAHPDLSIHQNQSGHDVTLYSNIGWSTNTGAAEQQVLLGAAASVFASPTLVAGAADSELLLTLPPGGYSAEVSGADGGTGVALCAIYELP